MRLAPRTNRMRMITRRGIFIFSDVGGETTDRFNLFQEVS
jgi:hypothetical protein